MNRCLLPKITIYKINLSFNSIKDFKQNKKIRPNDVRFFTNIERAAIILSSAVSFKVSITYVANTNRRTRNVVSNLQTSSEEPFLYRSYIYRSEKNRKLLITFEFVRHYHYSVFLCKYAFLPACSFHKPPKVKQVRYL